MNDKRQALLARRRLLLAGGAAGGLALSFLWAANRIEETIPFPPLAVAERIIRLTPGDVATFFIDALGSNALRLLTLAAIVGSLGVFALLPVATAVRGRVRPYLAGAIAAAATAGAALIGPVRPGSLGLVVGSFAAGALYTVSLAWLLDPGAGETDLSRRRALGSIAAASLGFAVGGTLLGRIARRLAGPNTDVAIRPADVPAQTQGGGSFPHVPGLTPEITSADDHYVIDIDLIDPVVEVDGWILSVGGLVDDGLSLSFGELQERYTLVEEVSVLTCISNPVGGELVGSSAWTGVRLGEVLADAGVRDGAIDVVFHCADGYSGTLPVEAAFDPAVILAVAQNGRPLTWEHGFPCRVRAPAVYGMKNPKWIREIEVVGHDEKGYWEQRGWSDVATVRTHSRIDAVGPEPRAGRAAWIAGIAWAGSRGISGVEVSVDGGDTWQQASLKPPVSRLAWTQWALRWVPPSPGSHHIVCRAVDGTGRRQEAAERPPHPSGASGYHTIEVQVE